MLLLILVFSQGESKKIFRIFINIIEYVKACTVPVLPRKAVLPHSEMELFTGVCRVPENLPHLKKQTEKEEGSLQGSYREWLLPSFSIGCIADSISGKTRKSVDFVQLWSKIAFLLSLNILTSCNVFICSYKFS